MMKIRKSQDRGRADLDWLDGYHTFSFANYHDPRHMGYSVLRVINEDRIAPGKGFGAHAHRDMEIITYVLEGRLEHRDSMGEEHILGPNEVQAMSAGTGIVHSEFNHSETEPVHLMQIWIRPSAEDLEPQYQQIRFDPVEKRGRLKLLAGPVARDEDRATRINQDARLWVTEIASGESVTSTLVPDRHAWIQVIRGEGSVNGQSLRQGDGVSIEGEERLVLGGSGPRGTEFLFFDLP
jgi:redox-sensitive bicupin YhaK (pirin superfamily)